MQAQVNGISIHYCIEGEGPWVTMSHSLACDLHMWDEESRRLSREFRVLRFDTRGHGGSSAPDGRYSLDLLATDLNALLSHLGILETHYIGLSMGGMVGQTLALRKPSMFKSLVLCDTSSRFDLDIRERVAIVESAGIEPMVIPTLQRFLSESFRNRWPEKTEQIAAMIRNTPVPGYLGCCQAVSRLNLTSQLHEIRCPVLVVVGENDFVTPVSMALDIRNAISGAEMAILADAAHLSNIEQPDAFNAAVVQFLRRLPK